MSEEIAGLDKLQKIFGMEIFDKKSKRSNFRPPTGEEVAVFIDKIMLPTFEVIKTSFDEYYEQCKIDQKKHTIGIDLIDDKETFNFAIGIDAKRQMFSIKAAIEFENVYNGVQSTVKISQFYDESEFDELNEAAMDSEGIIDLFKLQYIVLYGEKKELIARKKATVG